MKKKVTVPKMTLEVHYTDGRMDSVRDFAPEIRSRFIHLVTSMLPHYVDGVKEINLLDTAGRCFQSFKQYF